MVIVPNIFEDVKLCKDCTHYISATTHARCKLFEENEPDLVEGKKSYRLCFIMRGKGEECGPEGKYWEKPPTPPKRPRIIKGFWVR